MRSVRQNVKSCLRTGRTALPQIHRNARTPMTTPQSGTVTHLSLLLDHMMCQSHIRQRIWHVIKGMTCLGLKTKTFQFCVIFRQPFRPTSNVVILSAARLSLIKRDFVWSVMDSQCRNNSSFTHRVISFYDALETVIFKKTNILIPRRTKRQAKLSRHTCMPTCGK